MPASVTRYRPEAPEDAAYRALALTVETTGEELLSTMQDVAPEDTGDLIRGLSMVRSGRFERRFWSEEDYTEAVLRGTKPHEIAPKGSSPLSFIWDKAGGERVFFAGPVQHPGTEPQNFVARTLDIEQPRIEGVYFAEACSITRRSYGS